MTGRVMHRLQRPPTGLAKLQSCVGADSTDKVRDNWEDSVIDDAETVSLTRHEAGLLIDKLGSISLDKFLVKVLMWQTLAAIAAGAVAWLVSSNVVVGSAFYGAMCVVVPSALVAAVAIKQARSDALTHSVVRLMKLFMLELAKIVLTICLLLAAQFVLDAPHWIAIVAGFAVTLKVYWVVALMSLRQSKHVEKLG